MPLFKCSKCGCVENTALSSYWWQKRAFDMKLAKSVAAPPSKPPRWKPLCSECGTGKWHGEFAKKPAVGYKRDEDGFIYSQVELDAGSWDRQIKAGTIKIVGDA